MDNKNALKPSDLKTMLNQLTECYDQRYLSIDPLELARSYNNDEDRETAGFIAAVFALGRYDLIRKITKNILGRMLPSPRKFIESFDPEKDSEIFSGLSYRFYSNKDICLLVWWLSQMIKQSGSIEAFFLQGYNQNDENIGAALSKFVRNIFSLKTMPYYDNLPEPGRGARHFLTDPAEGSACKRLNLFLRWMVRNDFIDMGIWKSVKPSQLVIPLDTHIMRLSKCLGLTKRSSPGWAMALEITQRLAKFDPEDPVKYDFALCSFGKENACPKNGKTESCLDCFLKAYCLKCGN